MSTTKYIASLLRCKYCEAYMGLSTVQKSPIENFLACSRCYDKIDEWKRKTKDSLIKDNLKIYSSDFDSERDKEYTVIVCPNTSEIIEVDDDEYLVWCMHCNEIHLIDGNLVEYQGS